MEKNNTVQIGPRISPEAIEFYKKHFRNVSKGTAQIIEIFPAMYKIELRGMKGRFTQGERLLLLDMAKTNGNIGGDLGTIYAISNQKEPVEPKRLQKKLFALTSFQYAVLEIWAIAYWQGNHKKSEHVWIKELG